MCERKREMGRVRESKWELRKKKKWERSSQTTKGKLENNGPSLLRGIVKLVNNAR